MVNIAQNLEAIRSTLPAGVELVAVSKFHPVEALRAAYDAGQRVFGESRVQELMGKIPQMPADTRWHFIGHLQTNKVKHLIGHISLIESVDTPKLLYLIDQLSAQQGVTTHVLLQLHVAQEETKFGFTPAELLDFVHSGGFNTLKATHVCGVMGMASNTDDIDRIASDFRMIRNTFETLRNDSSLGLRGFNIVSMGMSHDYHIAIDCGSTMVRIGTDIFGERQY